MKPSLLACLITLLSSILALDENSNREGTSWSLANKTAYQIYKKLIKERSFIISTKHPDQEYLLASHFVEYYERPRDQLPEPLSGADR